MLKVKESEDDDFSRETYFKIYNRLEIINQKFVLSNIPDGAAAMIKAIVDGYGLDAAFHFVAPETAWDALKEAYRDRIPATLTTASPVEDWRAWAAGILPLRTLTVNTRRPYISESMLRQRLMLGFHGLEIFGRYQIQFNFVANDNVYCADGCFIFFDDNASLYEY